MAYIRLQDTETSIQKRIEKKIDIKALVHNIAIFFGERYPEISIRVEIQQSYETGEYTAVAAVYSKDIRITDILRFTVGGYPSCCAMMQLHTFSVNENLVSQDVFNVLMSLILQALLPGTMYFATGRVMVAMVQKTYGQRIETPEGKVYPRLDGKSIRYGVEGVKPIPLEQARIQYAYFYHYFQLQKKVNTTLMYNQNTGNIVHLLEVLFDVDNIA